MNEKQADVLVVGAGVVGLSVAYYAASAGAKVVILERGEIGAGSSSGNAGLVVPSFFEPLAGPGVIEEGLRHLFDQDGFFGMQLRSDPRFLFWLLRFARRCNRKDFRIASELFMRLNHEGVQVHNELARLGGWEYGFSQKGLLYLFLSGKRFLQGRERAAKAMEAGFASEVFSGDEVRDVEPAAGRAVVGGIRFLSDSNLDPSKFLEWLAKQAAAWGVQIRTETEVYDFQLGRNRVNSLLTTKGEFRGEQVVIAGGAWLASLGRRLGVKLPVEGGRGYSQTFSRPKMTVRQPLILDEHHVAVSPLSNALRITGALELSGLDLTINPERVRGIHRSSSRYLPLIEPLRPSEIWRGLRPCTPDGLPIVGRLQSLHNVIVAGGHDTKGMTLGPVTGQYVTRLLAGQSFGDFEQRLSPSRFWL
ncbi:MAG: FAD-dependent oxidoreductase [Desulfobacterota bacterium]|jgi:D-amino-acid dehydrogenase|nr:FAD-dependent oxidoreductase [Thermodesulfobacteriota bacterium]